DVRQQIIARIADFIQQLLADGQWTDQPATGVGLAYQYAPSLVYLSNGKTDVLKVGYLSPVGKVAASALRAALDQVPSQGRLGKAVIIVPGPAELMHQRRADQCAVDDT